MNDIEDPEVIADLRLRAASVYDRSRTRAVDVNLLWTPPVLVDEWRCRFPTCRVTVSVDADTVAQLASFNEELARRRVRGDTNKTHDIETHEVLICDAHQRLFNEKRAVRLGERVVELRDAIQKLKASGNPRSEKALIAILDKLHHPDVEGLLLCLEEKQGGSKKRRAL